VFRDLAAVYTFAAYRIVSVKISTPLPTQKLEISSLHLFKVHGKAGETRLQHHKNL
jgi:hypothetical protein